MAGNQKAADVVRAMIAAATDQARHADPLTVENVPRAQCDDVDLAFFPMTDLGNAERFEKRNRNHLIYVAAIGWLYWDGRRWARDGADEYVDRAAHKVVRAIQEEAAAIRDTDRDQRLDTKKDGTAVMLSGKLASWGRASEAATKISAIVKLGRSYLSVDAAALDSDPFKINVRNGTLTIDASRDHDGDPVSLRPHRPGDLITKLANVDYRPDATCPRYDAFLAQVQPHGDKRRFLHMWGGYSLTGDVGEQKLCFFYGKGRNGKSTLVDAWGTVAGDYGEIVPIETFVDQGRGRNAGAATPDLALLPGVRLLRTSEPEKGAKLAEALIKLVTGGEPIQARRLNRDYFKFRPSFKLTMSGNYRPKIDGTDEGIWRRVVLVPWNITIDVVDPDLPAKLHAEGSGILNRLLDGLRDYLEAGLIIPDDVAAATQDYREDSDPLGRFLNEAVEIAEESRVSSRRMHEVFCAWAASSGERQWTPKGFAMAMKERGFLSMKSSGMFWLHCRLTKSEADFAADDPPRPHDDGGG